jgi:hypothetical protein
LIIGFDHNLLQMSRKLDIDHLDIVRIFSPLYIEKANYLNHDWFRFINELDIGITASIACEKGFALHRYTISDEKKWLLSKLKYGF